MFLMSSSMRDVGSVCDVSDRVFCVNRFRSREKISSMNFRLLAEGSTNCDRPTSLNIVWPHALFIFFTSRG